MSAVNGADHGISRLELSRRLGVRYDTAWMMHHKLAQVMMERDQGKPLDGRVEMDDAYLGGERNGGKRGRGSPGKTAIVVAVETTPDRKPIRVKIRRVKRFSKKHIEGLATGILKRGAQVLTDGLDEQLVKLRRDGLANTEPFSDAGDEAAEHLVPVLAAVAHPLSADLTGLAHPGVDDRLGATPAGCLARRPDQRLGLRRQKRQRHCPDTTDLDAWRQQLGPAYNELVAGTADALEDYGEFVGDRHCWLPQPLECHIMMFTGWRRKAGGEEASRPQP